ncbi:yippee-like protein [Phycomyces nitens]|nr:yippee-like protein [Phycomyces nitens]
MGLKYKKYLKAKKIYGCLKCRTHLATGDKIISKAFHGSNGQAYLFHEVVNVIESTKQYESLMITGTHTIVYIACVQCGSQLGWKYIKAQEDHQKYKEGKYILEKTLLQPVK